MDTPTPTVKNALHEPQQVVWKFPFEVTDEFELRMPSGASVLGVAVQHGTPTVWAMVDPGSETEDRCFRIAGTGHPINNPSRLRFVGMFMLHGGDLVFHVFEVVSAKAGESRDG